MDEIQTFTLKKLFRLLGIYVHVFLLLLTRRYDLCYCAIACFGVPFLKDAPVVLLCKLFGCKVLIHQHNKGMSYYCRKPIYKTLYRWVYRHSKVMLLSWRLYDDIAAMVQRDQVLICPNGVDGEVGDSSIVRANEVVHLLYLSNLIPTKGCIDLLDACRLLKQEHVPFVCDFVGGDSPEMSGAQFQIEIDRRGLGDCVVYQGRKYGADKDAFFRRADIFVFPTFYPAECFPLVLLEAMQYQLPCVTTAEAAIPDMVIDGVNGLICPAQDAMALAEKIKMLIDHADMRREMGARGRSLYREKFTEKIFIDTFQACLAQCI